MRISDWSSDVCSSDLAIPLAVLLIIYILATKRRFVKPNWRARTQPSESSAQGRNDENLALGAADQRIDSCGVAGLRTDREPGSGRCVGGFARDRKSVVSGTRVSVRVGLGCSLIITKIHKKYQPQYILPCTL